MSYKTRAKAPKRAAESNRTLFQYIPPGEASNSSNAKEVITFTHHDHTQLQSPNYLNDTIISFFMQYHLDNYVDTNLRNKVHVFNSFFLSKLKSIYSKRTKDKPSSGSNHDDKSDTSGSNNNNNNKININISNSNNCASRWLKGVKIFEKDFLFLPVCENDHWLLVIVCYPKHQPYNKPFTKPDEELTEPAVFVLNSIMEPAAGVKKALQKFLANQWRIEMGTDRSFSINNAKSNGIRLLFPEVPQQRNNYNCGVYMLNYFKCFLKSPRESYIKMFRQRSLVNWFEENDIKIQSERSRMIEIVKKQCRLWSSPENRAKRALVEGEIQESQEHLMCPESKNFIIEIN